MCYYRHNQYHQMHGIPENKINFYELTILLSGEMSYGADGDTVSLKAGDAVFLTPNTVRSREEIRDVDYVSFNFYTDEPIALPRYIENCATQIVKQMLLVCDLIHQSTVGFKDERYIHLLQCILKQLETQLLARSENPLVLQIKEYIHNHIGVKVTLGDIGEATYFSPVYCDYVFKRETGTSIINYLLVERIKEAQQLMFEGSLSLRAISERVGFNDYNYFSRMFKKLSGYTPTQYKKNLQ